MRTESLARRSSRLYRGPGRRGGAFAGAGAVRCAAREPGPGRACVLRPQEKGGRWRPRGGASEGSSRRGSSEAEEVAAGCSQDRKPAGHCSRVVNVSKRRTQEWCRGSVSQRNHDSIRRASNSGIKEELVGNRTPEGRRKRLRNGGEDGAAVGAREIVSRLCRGGVTRAPPRAVGRTPACEQQDENFVA